MSLITEALKKTQQSKVQPNSKNLYNINNDSKPRMPSEFEKKHKLFYAFLAASALFVLILIALLVIINSPNTLTNLTTNQTTLSQQAELEPVTQQPQTSNPSFQQTETPQTITQTPSSLASQAQNEQLTEPLTTAAIETSTPLANTNNPLLDDVQPAEHTNSTSSPDTVTAYTKTTIAEKEVLENETEDTLINNFQENIDTKNTLTTNDVDTNLSNPRSQEIQSALKKMRITGVMLSGNNSRVLIDSNVYELNNNITSLPYLRIVQIAPHLIVFEDDKKNHYKKEF
jgi:hypothetical protein